MARNIIDSNNPVYRHWKRAEGWDITYQEMMDLWECNIELEKPIISCEWIDFYSLQDCAKHFGISTERVRQKLNDDKFLDWIYLYK